MTTPAQPTAQPTTMAAVLVRQSRICSRCRSAFEVSEYVAVKVCGRCVDEERGQALEAFRTQAALAMTMTLDDKLKACGYGPVELTASLDRVPELLKKRLPARLVRPLVEGGAIAEVSGFGISGGQGIGKTMTFAAIMRARTKKALVRLAAAVTEPPDGTEPVPWHAGAGFLWVNWPDQASKMKAQVMERDGGAQVEAFVRRASNATVLVIDDLGRERLGRNYDEDYSFGQLDRIIDARSRAIAPVLWTSNLGRTGLATRYGGALTSRLLGLAPAVELPKLPDIRLA